MKKAPASRHAGDEQPDRVDADERGAARRLQRVQAVERKVEEGLRQAVEGDRGQREQQEQRAAERQDRRVGEFRSGQAERHPAVARPRDDAEPGDHAEKHRQELAPAGPFPVAEQQHHGEAEQPVAADRPGQPPGIVGRRIDQLEPGEGDEQRERRPAGPTMPAAAAADRRPLCRAAPWRSATARTRG